MQHEGKNLKKFLSDNVIKVTSVAKLLGLDRGTIYRMYSEETFPKKYKDLLKSEYGFMSKSNANIVSDDPQAIELPLITTTSRASFNYEIFTDNSHINETAPVYKTRIKGLRNPVLIDIDGDSMSPQLNSNTRVLADEIDAGDWMYVTGVVAVSFNKQFVVKRIKDNRSIETGTLTLHSDNEQGGTFTVKCSDINAIWKVIEIVKAKVE